MEIRGKATAIDLFSFGTPQMRAFHMSWFAFFLCFFAWFGLAALMPIIREEMQLTPEQVGNLIIAAVSAPVIARLLIGPMLDHFGPRLVYTWLLILGAIPVMASGLATNYETLFWFRLIIGAIGASFVITQYHSSINFAPNIVGTANAVTAGWGNFGACATMFSMPLFISLFVSLGASEGVAWRMVMVGAGFVCALTGIAYFFLTQDAPEGNFKELRAAQASNGEESKANFMEAFTDYRVWVLFLLYGACFGMEITMNGMAALYYFDTFGLSTTTAPIFAALFGVMNLFARAMGGILSDRVGRTQGLNGRVRWLFVVLLAEGVLLILFSQMHLLWLAVASMMIFSFFQKMANGATFSVVPFISQKNLGAVAGIVGAGGNAGAVAAGFLFRSPTSWWPTALLILGCSVTVISFLTLTIRFPEAQRGETTPERIRSAIGDEIVEGQPA